MSLRIHWMPIALLGLAISLPLSAEHLQLKHRSLEVQKGEFRFAPGSRSFRGNDIRHNLVKVAGVLDQAGHDALKTRGLHLLQPLGDGVWIAGCKPSARDLAALPGVEWAEAILPLDKEGPGVYGRRFSEHSLYGEHERIFQVVFHRDVDLEQAGDWLRGEGVTADHVIQTTHTWVCAFDPELLPFLLETDEVLWIQEKNPSLVPVNSGARQYTHAQEAQGEPHNLRGEGVTVTVYDGGLVDTGHPAFEGRAIVGLSESGAVSDHPTHVAGSVGCNHASQYGMAPACEIISYEYEGCDPNCLYDSPVDIEADHGEAIAVYDTDIITVSLGANIYSNGYPCEWQGDYENSSILIDGIVRGSLGRPVIMTWAAGNERSGGPCGTSYETMSVPSGAKNPIIVGATVKDANDTMTGFSSWGPTDDGRVKPDVCAPGQNITSTLPGGGTGAMSGTSMATPVTAGCVAQLVQEYRRSIPGATHMPPALAKTLVIQTATDRGNSGPDYQYGFGNIHSEKAVMALTSGRWLEDRITQDQVRTYEVEVPAGEERFQVSMAWIDEPGAYLDVRELVNDLDLVLVAPDEQLHRPWVLNPASPGSAASSGVDSLNTVEQVTVSDPLPGTWTIRVTGSSIALGEQDFALAADLPLQEGNTGVLAGRLADSEDESPVIQAQLQLLEHPAQTQSNGLGDYRLRMPVGRDYTLSVSHPEYFTLDTLLSIAGSDTTWLDLDLEARPLDWLVVRVMHETTQIAGATVKVWWNQELLAEGVTTQVGAPFELPVGQAYDIEVAYSRDSQLHPGIELPAEGIEVALQIEGQSFLASEPTDEGYIMIDNRDLHPQAPVYDWFEIDPATGGPGMAMVFTGDDETQVLDLPFAFTHYGEDFTQLSVCGNGWVALGNTDDTDYSGDEGFPDPDGPPAILAPFWEDLSPQRPTSGSISWYHHAMAGLFIVEFMEVEQYTPETAHETFQVILRDPLLYPTSSGNNEILFQYGVLEDISEIAVGIENSAEDAGLQVYNNGEYHPNAPAISEGTAILFTSINSLGAVRGTVSLTPWDAGLFEQIRFATVGDTVAIDPEDGSFLLDSLAPGQRPFWAIGPDGVETLLQLGTVPVGDTLDLPLYDLFQLLPPRGLSLVSQDGPEISLQWLEPEWDETLNARKGTAHETDEFSDYRVYRMHTAEGDTELQTHVSNIDEPAFGETLETPGEVHYAISARYAGGESLHSDTLVVEADFTGIGDAGLPAAFYLKEPRPNPFNPVTRIAFGLPRAQPVRASVYNLLGQQVAVLLDTTLPAGHHQLSWNAAALASGAYILRLEHAQGVQMKKMLLLK